MRILFMVVLLMGLGTQAQVHLDRSLRAIATDSTLRGVDSLAYPTQADGLLHYGAARSGALHWATTAGSASTILLTMDPPATAYAPGMLIRFIPNYAHTGQVLVNVNGLGVRQVIGEEGHGVPAGQMDTALVAEIEYNGDVFVLRGRARPDCPPGFTQANDRFCFQYDHGNMMTFGSAARYCADRGARLCAWDEYIHACTELNGQLTNMFNEWEWIDDTSDHTHTADQVGRYSCISQRSRGAADGSLARPRCCYRIR